MKNKFINTAIAMIMLLSLAAAAIPLALPAPPAQANGCTPPPAGTWYVDDNGVECNPYCYYSTIQEAINAASAGDTIIVYNGTYNNANLTIDKPLTIISQNGSASTFINGGGSGIAVSIDASNVTFGTAGHGFTVSFGGQPGIAMYPTDGTEMTGVSIIDNVLHDCMQAIVFEFEGTGAYDFHNNTITDNTIYECGWAMWFDTSHEDTNIRNNTIDGNTIYNCGNDAITFYNDEGTEDIYENTISGNTIHNCQGTGITFHNDTSSGDIYLNQVSGNTIYSCSTSVYFYNYESSGNIYQNSVTGNDVYDCYNGIYFDNKDTVTGEMYGNTVNGNTIHDYVERGIFLGNDGQNNDTGDIYGNSISSNTVYNTSGDGYGIWLYNGWTSGNMSDNTVTGNEVYNCSDYGIQLDNFLSSGVIAGNNVSANTVYECEVGIELYETAIGGNIIQNTIADNTVYESFRGIGLKSENAPNIYYNTIDGNEVYDCYQGIYLESINGHVYANAVTENTVYNCYGTPDGTYPAGIFLGASSSGNTSINTVEGNIVYQEEPYIGDSYGIYLSTFDGGLIYGSTIEDNTVYGWDTGINLDDNSATTIEYIDILDNVLYNESEEIGNDNGIDINYCNDITVRGNDIYYSTYNGIDVYDSYYIDIAGNTVYYTEADADECAGIMIEDSEDIDITGNTVYYTDSYYDYTAGIYIWDSGYIYVCSNDIRYNDTDASGILVEDSGYITVTCNNIVDNWSWYYDDYVGLIGDNVEYGVYADDNWWGDPSGPGYGDAAVGDVYIESWLEEEVTLLTDAVIDYAAVPATVSLYDTDGLFGSDYYEADPIYTLGPSYTDIIVEVECTDSPCGIQLATVNLSTLLLDMLPADFQQRYVDTWDADLQEDWEDWLDDISNMEMPYYSTDDTCFYDFEFYLNDLLFSGWDCGETDYPCWGLEDFFFEEYSYEEAYMKLGILLFEELRLGNFEVPVTVYTCCDEDYCCAEYTVYVPLAGTSSSLSRRVGTCAQLPFRWMVTTARSAT